MPREIFQHLKGVWVSGQQLRISRDKKGSGNTKTHDRKSDKRPDKRSKKNKASSGKKNDRKDSKGESLSRIPPRKRSSKADKS